MKSEKRILEDFIKKGFPRMPINGLQGIWISLRGLSSFRQKHYTKEVSL